MLEIVEPGPLASVQDAAGRGRWRRFGVPTGGAADPWSARLANRLVGNGDDAALLEVTEGGAAVAVAVDAVIAVTGGLDASVDGVPMRSNGARRVRGGSVVRLAPAAGIRAYLAVAGGLAVEPVLGSAATDLRTGFGGHGGRALRAGDRLAGAGSSTHGPLRWLGSWEAGPIRFTPGPHAESLPASLLADGTWRVASEADRTGVRLRGPALHPVMDEVPSMGLAAGAIQVPPDGRPIIMLADRPVTGGYPVPAVVIGADIGRVAQLRPGAAVRLASASVEDARTALRHATAQLAAIEPLGADEDDQPAWAGLHG